MSTSDYLKKFEEIKARAKGTKVTDEESQRSAESVLDRIKTKIKDGKYIAPFTPTESGKTGWQKYLDDQKAQEDALIAESENESWWDKASKFLLESFAMTGSMGDSTLPMGQYTSMVNALREDVSYMRPQDDWSDEQRDAFGTLYLESPVKAYAYAEQANKQNKQAKEKAAIEEIQNSATDSVGAGIGHTIGAIAAAPLGLADFLNDLAYASAGREITADGNVSPFEYSQAVTGGISEHLNEVGGTLDESIPIFGGKGWGDVYGLGTSIAQSAASAYTLGGTGTLISYFGQGAAAGVDDALSRGASSEQALLYGTALGTFEGVTEKIGIDNLFKIGSSSTLKGAIKNVLKQAGAEGLEEGTSTVLGNIADAWIMQDKSNLNIQLNAYMSQGMSESEAQQKVFWDFLEGVGYDIIGGAVSGGVHGGVHTGIQTTVNNYQNKKYFGGQAQDMANEAAASEDANVKAVGEKYQQKLEGGKKLSGWDITELVEVTDAAKVKSAVEAQLKKLGETGDVSTLAEAITKQTQGLELSKKEQALIDGSKYGQRIVNTLDRDNIKSGKYATEWAESIGTRRLNADVYNKTLYDLAKKVSGLREEAEKESVTKSEAEIESEAGTKFEASESGKTVYTDATGEEKEVNVKKIVSTEGELKVELESGETVKASDVSFGTKEEALIYEMVSRMEATPETANEIISTFKPSNMRDATKMFTAIPLAYTYGKMGYEAGLKNVALSGKLAKIVYNRGRMDAMVQDKSNTKTAKKGDAKASVSKSGIIFENGYVYDESKANDLQKASMAGIETINKMSNLEVHVYESWVDDEGNRVYSNKGKIELAPNGYYLEGGNKIYIDINAGNGGEGAMLYTASHEIGHYIKEWNAKGFRELGDFLIKEYGKKGVPVQALLNAQKDKIKARYKRNNETLPSEAKLNDMAYEELVCDAMSDMFTDAKAYEKLAKLKAQNKTLWQKLGEAIKALLDKLKTALGVYKEKNVDVAQEAFEVRGFSQEVYDKLQDLYIKAFVEADANYEAAISKEEIITDGAVVVDESGKKFSIRSMKHDISEGKMFRDLMNYCGFTQEQTTELRHQLEDLVEYMNPFRDILDLNESYGREGRRYSPYKPNSDPLYTISLDYSTQCSKRLLTQYVIEQLQLRENRPMSAEEQMAIRDMLKEYGKVEKGLQVACVMCYVEAARLKSPKQIQKWLDDPSTAMRNFFADKNPEFSNYIKEKQTDFKESRGYSRDATKKEMSAKDRDALNKIRPKLRAEYKPSADEMKIIETASNLPNSTYLTASNLAELSETNPEIYKAYTAFIRTATRSKALETDEPYYYGDSTRDNGNGIIVSDSFIEAVNRENGMRFSSWSDWRIQHLLDWITAVIENSVRGAAMHGYTKYGDEVRVLGKTGMMFNLSGVSGTQTGLNDDGSLNFHDTESIDINEAIELREEFPETAGLQCIGVSKDHILALLRSDIIDYVIPYHTSGLHATLRRMGNIYGWADFTSTQHAAEDKSIEKGNAVDSEHWHQEPVFSEFFVGYDTGLSGVEAMQKSAENYKHMCKERGLKPKFLEFANEPGYWKLLIDRKMVNQKTNTLIKQKPVTPNFDFGVIKGIVDKYVANYDSGLEQRAFNHIVENWDNIPKRIRDLKKQGGTKAKSTKKAIDKLANETVAAQPKETKYSDRAAEDVDAFVRHMRGIVEGTGGWDVHDVFDYVRDNPHLNFIERIGGKDASVKRDLELFLAEIDDTNTLQGLSWFMGEAYKRRAVRYTSSGRLSSPYVGAVRTFRNAIHNRINEIMTAKANGTNLGVKNGEVSLDEVKAIFDRLNSNEDIGALAERVFATAKKLGVNIRFANQTFSKKAGGGDAWGDMVELKTSYFNDTAYTDQRKAQTILHELIHICTVYVMNDQGDFAGDVHYGSDKTSNYERIANAATRLNRIYFEIKNDPIFKGQYGIKNAKEMVAELANPQFVELLKKKTLWEKVLDWICELFGFRTGTSAYDNAMACLDYILDNPEVAEYKSHSLKVRQAAHRRYGEAFGSTVLADGQVRYSERDYSEGLSAEDKAVADKVIKSLKQQKMASTYGVKNLATYTADRMSYEIQYSSAKGDPDYAHSYITWVNPLDFVYATTTMESVRERLKEEAGKLDIDRLRNQRQAIYLNVDFKTGQILGHEGRHRMLALWDAGIDKVAVIIDAKNDEYWHTKPIEMMHLKGQKFEEYRTGTDFFLHNLLPLSERYASVAGELFAHDSKGGVRFQERDTTSVSNRTLLAGALEGVVQNDIEKQKLAQYKAKIAQIESEQKRLDEIRANANELRFTKGRTAEETKKMRDLDDEATQIANRISTYDKQLLGLESTKALKGVLEREKANLKKRLEAEGRKALKEQRQKNAEAVKGIVSHYQESRKKAVEGRNKTAMRHKIQKTLKRLNKLFKGSKERNVKEDMKDTVATALALGEILFNNEISNRDIVMLGVESVTETESKLLNEYHDLLIKKAANDERIESIRKGEIKPTSRPYLSEVEEHNRKIEARIAKLNKELSDVFARERARLTRTSVSTLIYNLATEYHSLQESKVDYIKKAYSADLFTKLIDLKKEMDGVTARDMSMAQLEKVDKVFTMLEHSIRTANQYFRDGKFEDLEASANAVMSEIDRLKDTKQISPEIAAKAKSFLWNELTPYYAFDKVGSETFMAYFIDLLKGQAVAARDAKEAKLFAAQTREKYGYAKWKLDEVYDFKLKDGRTFSTTLKHLLSVYAYSKREQAEDHMKYGGFFHNDKATFRKVKGVLKMVRTDAVGYKVDADVLEKIKAALGKEKMSYVDEMQEYLTKMGEKGNEVTRVMWGVDIFTEKVYFPLKSKEDFLKKSTETAQAVSLKNDGMTQETKPGASNPIVLEAFDDVWANHVERMSQYHGMVIPIDNLNKVLHYGRWSDTDSMSVSTKLEGKFTSAATDYLEQLINDLNGGVVSKGVTNPFWGFFSKWKKTKVGASLSTIIQQPTAILRAMAEIDAKYFVGKPNPAKLSEKWEEMQTYAPIAIIKEIGGFDAGSGRQMARWINSDTLMGIDKVGDVIDTYSMKGAELADKIGWVTIWEAVKREIQATTDLEYGSEAFLEKCGERATEVINKTQVYDSVLSRSGFMRSKNDSVKMLTSFMGEPTMSMNMLYGAILNAIRGGKGAKAKAARTIGCVYASIILAEALAALIYALRDDDEDESYLEKYLQALGEGVLTDIVFAPITSLPGVKDIVSIFQGWNVDRSDMAIFVDIKNAFDGLDSENKSIYRKIEDFSGAIAAAFGLPLKNVLRTGREIYNTVENIFDGISGMGGSNAFIEGLTGKEASKSSDLYNAIVNGDNARLDIYEKGYKTTESYTSAIRKALRENDPRIKEAAQARYDGDITEYTRIARQITSEGKFSQDDVVAAINSELNAIKKGEAGEETETETKDEVTSIYSTSDINAAFEGRDDDMALEIIQELIDTKVANGKTEKEAKSSLRSSMTSYYKALYKQAYSMSDSAEMLRIRRILLTSGLYGSSSDVVKTARTWLKD